MEQSPCRAIVASGDIYENLEAIALERTAGHNASQVAIGFGNCKSIGANRITLTVSFDDGFVAHKARNNL